MDLPGTIRSQYLAALAMLEQTIVQCPEPLWDSPDDTARFWHVAYHALFYTHLYLQDTEASFTPWARHRADAEQLPWPRHAPPQMDEPYDKAAIQEYLAFCKREVDQRVPQLDLAAGSGFYWLPFDKLELQFYSIRHIQQHAGELMERLGSRADIELNWVGTARPSDQSA